VEQDKMGKTDQEIKENLDSKLKKNKNKELSRLRTSVSNGIVTLEGDISELFEKLKVESLTKALRGVKGVINKISVLSESIPSERIMYFTDMYLSKIECYFGLIGVVINLIIIIVAAIITPGYNPFFDTVSSLGEGTARTLFSIGFVIGGSLSIPFILYLEKTLRGINDFLRRIATSIAIITSLCIALVAILPDPLNPEFFQIFHSIVAFTGFIGSVVYICLYSGLMLKSGHYTFLHVVIGFATGLNFLLLLLTDLNPLVEWILTINIQAWIIYVAINLILK
jgi:hypothetical protein